MKSVTFFTIVNLFNYIVIHSMQSSHCKIIYESNWVFNKIIFLCKFFQSFVYFLVLLLTCYHILQTIWILIPIYRILCVLCKNIAKVRIWLWYNFYFCHDKS